MNVGKSLCELSRLFCNFATTLIDKDKYPWKSR